METHLNIHRSPIVGEANNVLFNNGWSQEQIDILPFRTLEEAKCTTFKSRE